MERAATLPLTPTPELAPVTLADPHPLVTMRETDVKVEQERLTDRPHVAPVIMWAHVNIKIGLG